MPEELDKYCLPDHRLLVVSSPGRQDMDLFSVFYKSTNPIYEDSTLMILSLPKAPLPPPPPHLLMQSPLGVIFQHLNLGGHRHLDQSSNSAYFIGLL